MNDKNKWYSFSASSKIKDSTHNSHVYHFVKRVHSLRIFQIIAGICQILLGLSVITVSVLGLIKPLWVSVVLSMIGSVTTMIGLYLVYIMTTNSDNHNSLIRSAIRRVMKARN